MRCQSASGDSATLGPDCEAAGTADEGVAAPVALADALGERRASTASSTRSTASTESRSCDSPSTACRVVATTRAPCGDERARDGAAELTGSAGDDGDVTFEAHRGERYRCSRRAGSRPTRSRAPRAGRCPTTSRTTSRCRARSSPKPATRSASRSWQAVTPDPQDATARALVRRRRARRSAGAARRRAGSGRSRGRGSRPRARCARRGCARDRVDGRLVAGEAPERARVEQRGLTAQPVDLVRIDVALGRPRTWRERDAASGRTGVVAVERADPRRRCRRRARTRARRSSRASTRAARRSIPTRRRRRRRCRRSRCRAGPAPRRSLPGAGSGCRPAIGAAGAARSLSMSAQTAPGM